MRSFIALATALSLTWTQVLATGAFAQEADGEKDPSPRRVRTIQGEGSDGWSIVDIRPVEGTVIVLTPLLGLEVDLEEANRFALFQGRNVFNNPYDIRLFNVAVAGLQSAVFMRRPNGKPVVVIKHRTGSQILNRTVPLKNDDELRLLREYVENFDAIQEKTYTLSKTSALGEDEAYPMETEDRLAFDETRTRASVRRRTPASVVMKDGERLKGEFVPVYEDGQVLLETDQSVRRLSVDNIDRLRFLGDRGSAALGGAVRSGVGGAATGALAGSLAAWQSGASVKRTALFAAVVFGVVGFVFGMLSGTRSARGSREFTLGPVAPDSKESGDGEASGDEGRDGRGER